MADYLENYYSWPTIENQTGQIVHAILLATLVKWWIFVVIAALLAAVFLHFDGKAQIVAVVYLIAAVGAVVFLDPYLLVK